MNTKRNVFRNRCWLLSAGLFATLTGLPAFAQDPPTGACLNTTNCSCTDALTEHECTGVDRNQPECNRDIGPGCPPGHCCLSDSPSQGAFGWCVSCINDWSSALRCADVPCTPVPTLSEWGLGTLVLLLLSGVALKFGRRRVVTAYGVRRGEETTARAPRAAGMTSARGD